MDRYGLAVSLGVIAVQGFAQWGKFNMPCHEKRA
jgi:hypothetical protein